MLSSSPRISTHRRLCLPALARIPQPFGLLTVPPPSSLLGLCCTSAWNAAPQPGMPHPASPLFLPNKIQLQPLCQCHGPSQAVSSTPFPGCLRHTVLSFYPPRDLCAWTLPQLDRQPPGSNPGCGTPNYSFDPHLLSAYYVAGHVLDVGQIMMNNSN